MTQGALDLFSQCDRGSEVLIVSFQAKRKASTDSAPTITAESSQLRSLAKDAHAHFGLTLAELLSQPEKAANVIEIAGRALGRSTVQTRARAVQKLAMLQLGEREGRRWVASFRAALPKESSRGWHDEGVSLPGSRSQSRPRSPTPDHAALEAILQIAASQSQVDAAIAGLVCFSGLELDELSDLRWQDVRWRDERGSTFCEVNVWRRDHRTTCLIVPMAARPLLSLALASGFQREAFVLPGRRPGTALSKGAIRDRLRRLCQLAGWPGLSRAQLCAAFVMWLCELGYDDHSIRLIIGRRRVATIDRLLQRSRSIAAQLQVDDAHGTQALDESSFMNIMIEKCNEWF